ncbi:hypothetical protein [Ottowia sp. SB7-C50]|jgi:cytochrome c551/c552|uniref:hypothetical protein n=1 Tax=Ottowia sp. SB7-C50 TaxID=3081231 RepID=UPI002953D3E2|nr:hypothetical protein [Ottowia sp. SB7-C50]WOP15781.1 hypothetical protein R0D99_01505 [Ottowia sp. SB7-C50]
MKNLVRAACLVLCVIAPGGAALAQAPAPVAARPGASLAADMGCLNCHGTPARGEAPEFRLLRERAASRGNDRAGVARHWADEMRETSSGWRAIVGHRQVSDATVQALTDWLTSADSKPVN